MTAPRTLTELFFGAMRTNAGRPVALRIKRDGAWQALSFADFEARVQAVGAGLRELGVERGDRVAILSENRPEWAITDYACLAIGCADVPIYPTLPARQIAYILRDAGAVVVAASTPQQVEKILAIRDELPALKHVIAFDAAARGPDVIPFADLEARGRAAAARYPRWREEALAAQPDDLATLIYTSGTTGDPKGVMLTHGNITSNVVSSLSVLPITPQDEALSFLPLSHIFERMVGHYTMLHGGVPVSYATSVDTVAAEMGELRPTIMAAVPRLYEKIYARVIENATSAGGAKRAIFLWAKEVGERWADLRVEKRPIPAGLALQKRLADKLVFSKLRARVGGRIRFFVSGGAPLSADIARFFYAAGLPVLEGYGLTETSPVIACNTFDHHRFGTVGRPIPGVEVRIEADGEIVTRGPNVMRGYYNKTDATAELMDPDGWFHTGDIGELDADGFLRITDRKKDLIVTAGGKNIAPQPIENLARTSKFVANAVMLGDKRRFPIMLVVPNLEPLRAWAQHKGLRYTDDTELLRLPETAEKLDREIRKALAELAQFERPKKLLLLSRDFTIEAGELTPKLSVRRRVVEETYRREIEALYAEGETAGGAAHLTGA